MVCPRSVTSPSELPVPHLLRPTGLGGLQRPRDGRPGTVQGSPVRPNHRDAVERGQEAALAVPPWSPVGRHKSPSAPVDRVAPTAQDGVFSLASTTLQPFAQLAAMALFDPTTVTGGSKQRKRWRCSEGHIWSAQVSNLSAGQGCPNCAVFGYKSELPGWVYLMRHDEWEMLQVGITNEPVVRLAAHARLGWQPLDIRGPMSGTDARECERSILQLLESRLVPRTPSSVQSQPLRHKATPSRRGEAWWQRDFEVTSLKQLLNLANAAETAE